MASLMCKIVESESNRAGTTEKREGLDPTRWVDEYGEYLFAFAMARLRDPVRAEDLVQETFLAGLKSTSRFAGRSNERTWLIGILKFKIADHYRAASRETSFTDLDFYADSEKQHFTEQGAFGGEWVERFAPQEWPREAIENLDRELFWEVFHRCSAKLPTNVAAVFLLREVDGLAGKEICEMLKISEANYWVMLHRARLALRQCLEANWFAKETQR